MTTLTTDTPTPAPLCVDCDGTLLRTDLLVEGVLALAVQAPGALWRLPLWLLRGRAHLKARIAERVELDWASLPLRTEVVERIERARAQGRPVVLATASHETMARKLDGHLALFDDVLATRDDGANLKGQAKADALVQRYGERGFDYIGDSVSDLPVWAAANASTVVARNPQLVARAREVARVDEVIAAESAGPRALVKALRPHQWAKNLLVFVPLLTAHAPGALQQLWPQALLAFIAFGLCASAAYVFNDLLDLSSDRRHARKRRRPFASGALPLAVGFVVAPLLVLGAFAIASLLPPTFAGVLAFYFGVTLAYSLRLKRHAMVDVITLAGLYTLRIVAGAAATAIEPSFWLMAFSMFIFLSLALVKRYTELRHQAAMGEAAASGRGYRTSDLPVLLALGAGSGMVAVLVFALFINAPTTLAAYRHPIGLWLVTPLLLYWCARIWLKAHRDLVHDDPLVFALRDRPSLAVLGIGALLVWWAR